MLALPAMIVGRLRLLCHVAWHVLRLSNEPHRAIRDARYRRDDSGLRSLEYRCLCGRVYFQWWTRRESPYIKGRVRR